MCACWLQLCNQVRFVSLDTNLNLFRKKSISKLFPCLFLLSAAMALLLFSECEKEQSIFFLIYMNPDFNFVIVLPTRFNKMFSLTLSATSSIILFTSAFTPGTHLVCLFVFQNLCHSIVKTVPRWVSILLILLSNDIHLNPGPQNPNNFLNFMTWNPNSITINNFERLHLHLPN